MQQSKRKLGALLLLLFLCAFLHGCSDDTVIPVDFPWEEESLPALGALGEEFAEIPVEITLPPEEPVLDEEGNEIPSPAPTTYVYNEMENSGSAVEQYVALLTGPDYEFAIVNAAGKLVDPPDYTEEEGFVVLSRANIHTQTMLRFTVLWEPGICTINLYRVDALEARTDTEEPRREISPTGEVSRQSGSSSGSSAGGGGSGMAAEEVVTFFQNLSPATLGLEGEGMADYHIYYMDGKVLINGNTCSRVRIYTTSYPEESNAFLGTFLVSNGGQIYKHDIETDTMIELSR